MGKNIRITSLDISELHHSSRVADAQLFVTLERKVGKGSKG